MNLDGKKLHILTPMYGGWNAHNFFRSFNELLLRIQSIRMNGVHYDGLCKFYETATKAGATLPPMPPRPEEACASLAVEYSLNWNESLISRARNRLVDQFLKGCDCTHALFVDADIGFNPQDVLTLLSLDKDIIGVPCVKKGLVWERIQRAIRSSKRDLTPDELSRIGGDFVFNFEKFDGLRHIQMDELQEMRNLGTGLLLIKREVFVKFREEYPDRWFEPRNDTSFLPGPVHDFFKCAVNPETREYDSEDYWFCMDAKKIGYKIWMFPSALTTHMGSYTFIGDMPAVSACVREL